MTLIELMEDFDRHPPTTDVPTVDIVLGLTLLMGYAFIALVSVVAPYQPPDPIRVVVELSPSSTVNLASVVADIQAEQIAQLAS